MYSMYGCVSYMDAFSVLWCSLHECVHSTKVFILWMCSKYVQFRNAFDVHCLDKFSACD